MERNGRFSGTARYLSTHAGRYALAYGSAILALLFIGFGIEMGWLSLIPFSLLIFLGLAYFIIATLWAAHRLYDPTELTPHRILFEMAQLRESSDFTILDLGLRWQAHDLASLLTTGHATVIDIYNPQWTPHATLRRARSRTKSRPADPRLNWRNSDFRLLPLPDSSTETVIACEILSRVAQEGDQLVLLKEIHRVLTPNGRLLLAERTQTQINWLTFGNLNTPLKSESNWRHLLVDAGFRVGREQSLSGLIHCLRADKPLSTTGQQLRLDLQLDEGTEAEGKRFRGGLFS